MLTGSSSSYHAERGRDDVTSGENKSRFEVMVVSL